MIALSKNPNTKHIHIHTLLIRGTNISFLCYYELCLCQLDRIHENASRYLNADVDTGRELPIQLLNLMNYS